MDDERLLDTSDLPLEREILRAAADETVPPDVRRRALASLGLLVIAPTAAAAAGAGASTAKGASAAVVGKSFGWHTLLTKAGLLLGLGGTAVGGAVVWQQVHVEPQTDRVETEASTILRVPAPARGEAMFPSSPHATTQPSLDDVPRAPQTQSIEYDAPAVSADVRRAPPSRRAPATVQRDSTSVASSSDEPKGAASIRDEIDRLDRARAELRRGAPSAAMAILREYFARYPNGELKAEAELVRRDASRTRE